MESIMQVSEWQPQIERAFAAPCQKIQELADVNAKMVFEYESKTGNKLARSHIYSLRTVRADIERARKEAKESALVFGRAVDARAKDLDAKICEMIDIHQKPLDAIEQREKDRLARIDQELAIVTVSTNAFELANIQLQSLRDRLAEIESYEVSAERLMEFTDQATEARAGSIEILTAEIARREQAAAERAELERLRAEAEAARRAEEIRKAAEAAAEREREAAAQRAAAEAARVKAEQEAAERRQQMELERIKLKAEAATRKAEADAKAAIEAAERRESEAKAAAQRQIEQAAEDARKAAEAEAIRKAKAETVAIERSKQTWETIAQALIQQSSFWRQNGNNHNAGRLQNLADGIKMEAGL